MSSKEESPSLEPVSHESSTSQSNEEGSGISFSADAEPSVLNWNQSNFAGQAGTANMSGDNLLFSGYSPSQKISTPYFYQVGDKEARIDYSALANYIFINVQGNNFYAFTNTYAGDNNSFCKVNPETWELTPIDVNGYFHMLWGKYLYYLDWEPDGEKYEVLCRMNLQTFQEEILTTHPTVWYGIENNMVYALVTDERRRDMGLCRIPPNAIEDLEMTLIRKNIDCIAIQGSYVYFGSADANGYGIYIRSSELGGRTLKLTDTKMPVKKIKPFQDYLYWVTEDETLYRAPQSLYNNKSLDETMDSAIQQNEHEKIAEKVFDFYAFENYIFYSIKKDLPDHSGQVVDFDISYFLMDANGKITEIILP